MKKLFIVVLIAVLLRLWQLGNVPISPDWDEAALGYNAYSILLTGRDEYGDFLPLILRSFGDYKPALYSYLIIPFLPIFRLTVFAVRLPSAIMGVVAVLATYFLVKELFQTRDSTKKSSETIALLAAALLAISPWHIQFSRVAFEANVGLTWNILMALFFVKGLKQHWILSLSVLCGVLSLYTYQSEKVFTPLLLLTFITVFSKQFFTIPKKQLFFTLLVGIITILPFLLVTVSNTEALARARSVSIFSDNTALLRENAQRLIQDKDSNDYVGMMLDNRRIVYTKTIIANYISHFDFVWLFIKGDYGVARHHAPHMGLEYLMLLPFLLIGIYQVVFGNYNRKTKIIIFAWTFLAPLPAAITTGVPHAVRTINFLPIIQVYISLGLLCAYYYVQKKRKIFNVFYLIFGIFFLLNFSYYFNQYYIQQNYFSAADWQYGYKEVINFIKPRQNNYKKIIVYDSQGMSQSYIFFLFYLQYNPQKYQNEHNGIQKKFAHYEFRSFNQQKEDNYLYVGLPGNFSGNDTIVKQVYYPDGKPAMTIAEGNVKEQ